MGRAHPSMESVPLDAKGELVRRLQQAASPSSSLMCSMLHLKEHAESGWEHRVWAEPVPAWYPLAPRV